MDKKELKQIEAAQKIEDRKAVKFFNDMVKRLTKKGKGALTELIINGKKTKT